MDNNDAALKDESASSRPFQSNPEMKRLGDSDGNVNPNHKCSSSVNFVSGSIDQIVDKYHAPTAASTPNLLESNNKSIEEESEPLPLPNDSNHTVDESHTGDAVSTTPPTRNRVCLLLAHWTIQLSSIVGFIPILGAFLSASDLGSAVLFELFVGTDTKGYLEPWVAAISWFVVGPPFGFLAGYAHFAFAEKDENILWNIVATFFYIVNGSAIWITNYMLVIAFVKTIKISVDLDGEAAIIWDFSLFFATLFLIGPVYSFITGNIIDWFISSIPFAIVNEKWKASMRNENSKLAKANTLLLGNSAYAAAFMPAYTWSKAVLATLQYWTGDDMGRQAQAPVYGWSLWLFTFLVGVAAFADLAASQKKFEEKNKQVVAKHLRHDFIPHLFSMYQMTTSFLPAVMLWDIIEVPFVNDRTDLIGIGVGFALLGAFVVGYFIMLGMGESFSHPIATNNQLLSGYAVTKTGGVFDLVFFGGEQLSIPKMALKLFVYLLFGALASPLLKWLKGQVNPIIEYPKQESASAGGGEGNNANEEVIELIRTDNNELGVSVEL